MNSYKKMIEDTSFFPEEIKKLSSVVASLNNILDETGMVFGADIDHFLNWYDLEWYKGMTNINCVYGDVRFYIEESKYGYFDVFVKPKKKRRHLKGETFSWSLHPKESIRSVIFNEPATIVFWEDDTKTVVKCNQNEEYDPEKGLAMAIAKKYLGNQGNYYDVFRDNLKKYKPFKPEVSQCHSRDVVEELIEDGILKGTALDEYDELYQNDDPIDRDYEDSEMWAPFHREDGTPTDVEVSTYGRVRKKKTLKEVRQYFIGPKLHFTYNYDGKPSSTATDLAVVRTFIDPTIKGRSRRIVHLGNITDNNVNNLTVLK